MIIEIASGSINKMELPEEVVETIRKNEKEFLIKTIFDKYVPLFGISSLLPQYYFKGDDLDRIEGVKRIRACINDKNLKYWDVPNKYIYTFTTGQKIVIADFIERAKGSS